VLCNLQSVKSMVLMKFPPFIPSGPDKISAVNGCSSFTLASDDAFAQSSKRSMPGFRHCACVSNWHIREMDKFPQMKQKVASENTGLATGLENVCPWVLFVHWAEKRVARSSLSVLRFHSIFNNLMCMSNFSPKFRKMLETCHV
jgi:hypothetical protein